MEIEIPKDILELAEKLGHEVIDVRAPKAGDKYIGASTIITAIGDYPLSGVCYIVKKKEWVPKEDENFYYVASRGEVADTIHWHPGLRVREKLIQVGNYFKTEEQAMAASAGLPEFFARFRVEV